MRSFCISIVVLLVVITNWTNGQLVLSSEERQLLSKIYSSTGGNGWTVEGGWKSEEEMNCESTVWENTITCNGNGSVVEIDLSSNGLDSFNLPSNMFLGFDRLESLILDDNSLAGPLFLLPSSLVRLSIKNNRFNGDIPSTIGINPQNALEFVDLRNNRFSGSFPDLNITRNFTLYLDYNSLSSFATVEWSGNSSGYLSLSARSCGLNAQLSSFIFNSEFHLVNLDLTSNRLFGYLPSSFSHPESILSLLFSYNELEGSISLPITLLINLKRFEISHNSFSKVDLISLPLSLLGEISGETGCSAQYNRIQCLPLETNFGTICPDWNIGVGTGVSSSYYIFTDDSTSASISRTRSSSSSSSLLPSSTETTLVPTSSSPDTGLTAVVTTALASTTFQPTTNPPTKKREQVKEEREMGRKREVKTGTIRVMITGHLLKGAEVRIGGIGCSNVSVESTNAATGDYVIGCTMRWMGALPLRLESSLVVIGASCISNPVQFITTSFVCVDQFFCPSCSGSPSVSYNLDSLVSYLQAVQYSSCANEDFNRIVSFVSENGMNSTIAQCNFLVNYSLSSSTLQPPSFCLNNLSTIDFILNSGKRLNQATRTAILHYLGDSTQKLALGSFFTTLKRIIIGVLSDPKTDSVTVQLDLEVSLSLFSESNFLTSLDHVGVSLERVQNFTFVNGSSAERTLVRFDVSSSKSSLISSSSLVTNLQRTLFLNSFALGYPTRGIEVMGGNIYISESANFSLSLSKLSSLSTITLRFAQSLTSVYFPTQALKSGYAVLLQQLALSPFKLIDPKSIILSDVIGVSVLDAKGNRMKVEGLTETQINITIPFSFNAPLVNGRAVQCLHWEEDEREWSPEGCVATIYSTFVVCSCTHLTNFSLGYVEPKPSSAPLVAPLPSSDSINLVAAIVIPIVLVAVAIIVVLFIVFYLRRKERKLEKKKSNLIQMDSLKERTQTIEAGAIERNEKIGNGAYSNVFRGTYGVATSVAMKQKISEQLFSREEQVVSQLHHPNIVQYIGQYYDLEGNRYLIFEYLNGGTLLEFIRHNGGVKDYYQSIVNQLCGTLRYLEEQQVVHGDLSSKNILLQSREIGMKDIRIKLIDFGMARFQGAGDAADATQLAVRYAAPEVMKGSRNWSTKSDVWSFGVVLWEMFNEGQIPYGNLDNSQVVSQVRDYGKRLAFRNSTPPIVKDCATSCWMMTPQDRPSFSLIASTLCNQEKTPFDEDSNNIGIYSGLATSGNSAASWSRV